MNLDKKKDINDRLVNIDLQFRYVEIAIVLLQTDIEDSQDCPSHVAGQNDYYLL